MPEEDSSPDSLELGRVVADWLGIRSFLENITPLLEGAGCYRRRDEAIRTVVPEYGPGYKSKIVLPAADAGRLQHFFDRGRVARRRAAAKRVCRWRRVSGDRRRDQLQAARSQDDGVLLRRPLQLRGDRHAESAGVRSGLLRQERRRRRRSQADRASVQDPGIQARRVSSTRRRRSSGGRRPRIRIRWRSRKKSSTSRCPTTSSTSACSATTTASRRKASRPRSISSRRMSSSSTATFAPSVQRHTICTSDRFWWKPSTSFLRFRPAPC